MKRDILILSPHWDDFFLSMSTNWLLENQARIVVYIMSKFKPRKSVQVIKTLFPEIEIVLSDKYKIPTRKDYNQGVKEGNPEWFCCGNYDIVKSDIESIIEKYKPELVCSNVGLVHPEHMCLSYVSMDVNYSDVNGLCYYFDRPYYDILLDTTEEIPKVKGVTYFLNLVKKTGELEKQIEFIHSVEDRIIHLPKIEWELATEVVKFVHGEEFVLYPIKTENMMYLSIFTKEVIRE